MATVYVARLSSIGGFGKLVAVKVLLPHLRSNREFVNMLLDEARISGSIHHENVVQVHDIDEHEGTPYVAMELLRGRSLRRLYGTAKKRGEALPPGLLMGILARAAEGLHAAHWAKDATGKELGVIHRDVSPENIHVGYDGQVKVLDFGIAAAAGRLTETTHGEVKGKVRYLAPEQLSKSRPSDHRVDVWALGVVAHELLSCRPLFAGEDAATTMWNVLNQEVPDVREMVPSLPRVAARAIRAATDRDVDKRPESCAELMHAFDEAAKALHGGTKPEIAHYMNELYAKDRAIEDERIAAALREGPAPPLTPEEDEIFEAPPAPPRRRVPRVAAVVGAIALVGALAVALVVSTSEDDSSLPANEIENEAPLAATTPQEEASTAPGEPAAVATPEARQITVDVDDRARLVLVDGERHEERPLTIQVASEPVLVELMGPNGEMNEYQLDADDDGATLSVAAEPTSRPRGSRMGRRRGTPSKMEPSRDIVRDVF